jgi:hypothetical protein
MIRRIGIEQVQMMKELEMNSADPPKFPILGNAMLSVTIKDGQSSKRRRPVHRLGSAI